MKHPDEPDPDAPLTDDEFARGRSALLARQARAATGLSQENFAVQYGIALSDLKDWELGRRRPDQAAETYLRVIARIPSEIAHALEEAK